MKKSFPGYFELSKNQLDKLWNDALFVPDANILLNFYKFSDPAREDFFKIFDAIKARIWLPHQAAYEYFDNRLGEISKHVKEYEDMISVINNIEQNFESSKQHPFLSDELFKKLCKNFKEVKDELTKNNEECYKNIKNDPIKERLAKLFKNRVGPETMKDKLKEIYEEGEQRYELKIPPGFSDVDKEPDRRKYGDLIIWKQIIEKSKRDKKDIIFITDERKEDWWLKYDLKNEIVSPHPSLIKEFKDETAKNFYMYRADRFVEFASEYSKQKIKKDTISEIRGLRKKDEQEHLKWREMEETESMMHWKSSKMKQIHYMELELENIKKHRLKLLNEIFYLNDRLDSGIIAKKEMARLEILKNSLIRNESREEQLKNRIERIKIYFDLNRDNFKR